MAVASYILPRFQAFDDYGRPMVGAKLYTYQNKTTTPAPTYQDAQQSAANTNPIVLDASGEAVVYLLVDQIYTFVLKDSDDVAVWSQDDVTGAASPQDLAKVLEDLAAEGGSAGIGFQQSGAGAVKRSSQSKMREDLTAADYGAAGDGADQTAKLQALITEGSTRSGLANIGDGIFGVSASLALIPNGTLAGAGPNSTMLSRLGSGNLIDSPLQNGATIRGITLNMRRSITGSDGHGLAATGEGVWADAMVARDFGSATGSGGGTGILIEGGGVHRLTNCAFYGDPTAGVSFGWILGGTTTSFAQAHYSQGIVGYGHELKNEATYNNIGQLISKECNWALAYGREAPSAGASFNVASGVVGKACDAGLIAGQASYNLFSSMLFDQTGSPGREPDTSAVRLSGAATGNAAFAMMSYGSYNQTSYLSGNRNFVQLVAHDTSTIVARITAGSRQNAIEISHPGQRTSILSAVDDSSGQALDGGTANPIWCNATGQRIGSLSGTFHDRLGVSGALMSGNHRWRKEHNQYAITALATPGNTGDIVGWSYSIPGQSTQGKMFYAKGANNAADQLVFGIGAADTFSFTQAYFRPEVDNFPTVGTSGRRFATAYLGSNPIVSSDANLKKIRGPILDAELRAWAKAQPTIYQWRDAIAEKGEDGARLHAGYIAQEVEAAFTSEGLDPRRYAMFCEDDVFDTVTVKQMVSRQKFETEVVRVPRVEVADGRAIQVFDEQVIQTPLFDSIPLVDVDGNPVKDEDGNPVTHQIPAMHQVEEDVEVQVPAGKRLALRYEQCSVFEAAYGRLLHAKATQENAELRALLAQAVDRISALEARP